MSKKGCLAIGLIFLVACGLLWFGIVLENLYSRARADILAEIQRAVQVDELPVDIYFEQRGKPIDIKGVSVQAVVGVTHGQGKVYFVIRTETPLPEKFVRTSKLSPGLILVIDLGP